MILRSALVLLALFPTVAEARPRAAADLGIERARATSSGAVGFTVVNWGERRSRAATVRVTVGAATASVDQPSLRPRARVRRTVKVTGLRPGTWRAQVCARPRGERVRGNDCATAPGRITVRAPAFSAPAPTTPAELVLGAAPVGDVVMTPAAGATVTPDPGPERATPTATASATATPGATATPTATTSATVVPTPTPTPTATATATASATPTASATATATSAPTATATATVTVSPTATATASPFPGASSEVAGSYQQNPAHDGRIQGTAPEPPLAVAWRTGLGSSVWAHPVIAEGRVFAVTSDAVLHALDLRNGAILWSRAVGEFKSTVAYDAGRVYVTDGYGFMLAIDADSGLVLWSQTISEEHPAVAANGRLYLAGAGVLDGATGAVLAEHSSPHGTYAPPAVDGTRVYFGGSCRSAAYTLSPSAQAWRWNGSGSCTTGSYASIRDGRLYNPSPPPLSVDDKRGYIHDAATGAVLGRFPSGFTPALTDDGAALITSGDTVTARDATTQADRWTFRAGT